MEVAKRIWHGLEMSPRNPAREPWTKQDAVKIARDLAVRPAPPLQQRSNGKVHTVPCVISATELMHKEFPPIRFLIPGLWPEGMSLLAAKPKIGKTWLALDVAIAIAYGGVALGKLRVGGGDVLYLALEDGERRIQGRLRALLVDQDPPSRLHFAYAWPRVSEGGNDALDEWMAGHPETRLVVIDTLRRIRPRERVGASSYNQDYDAIAPLADLSHRYNISVWGISHLRKMTADDPMETVSGTMGLTGASDHVAVLQRERGAAQAILRLMSRDTDEQELALEWQAPRWLLVGNAREVRQSEERKNICDLIRKAGRPLSPKDVTELTGKARGTIGRLLSLMALDGTLIVDSKGHYDVFPRDDAIQKCACGHPVWIFGADGKAYCEQHIPEQTEQQEQGEYSEHPEQGEQPGAPWWS